jgi:predicted PhzF superfamily epimerase YddE/YHI9
LPNGDLDARLPLEVVSTGLRYLIVPVRDGALARARISHRELDLALAQAIGRPIMPRPITPHGDAVVG